VTDRILDLSETPARLRALNANLVVERPGAQDLHIPFADLAVLILAHPQVVVTQPMLAHMADSGGVLIVCNGSRLPNGILLPVAAHFTQTERLLAQAALKKPAKKRLWRQVVRAKIKAQARVLNNLYGHDGGLGGLLSRVRSGDPANVEAQAARRYWPLLFGDLRFRRDHNQHDQNRLLNYGYAVLRAVVARAICGVGLHPSLGLNHHNRYNPYCLADDLMEPLRPLVDAVVVEHVKAFGAAGELNKQAKQALLEMLLDKHDFQGEARTLFDVSSRMAASLAAAVLGETQRLNLPE